MSVKQTECIGAVNHMNIMSSASKRDRKTLYKHGVAPEALSAEEGSDHAELHDSTTRDDLIRDERANSGNRPALSPRVHAT